jgi:hypothetical protein
MTDLIVCPDIYSRVKMRRAQFTHIARKRSGLPGVDRIQVFFFAKEVLFRFTVLCLEREAAQA